jgi:hypothetical protein
MHCSPLYQILRNDSLQIGSAKKAVAASSAELPLVTAETVASWREFGGRIVSEQHGGQSLSRSTSNVTLTLRHLHQQRSSLLVFATSVLELPSAVNKNDPWDPHHIDGLPAEIRQYVAGICKSPPSAQHDFATYSPHEKRWRINLEYLRCDGLGEYRRGNQCLDVDFVAVGSHFRLIRKQYADCGF